MALPPGLSTCVVTGTFLDATGKPLGGKVTFKSSAVLSDATGKTVLLDSIVCHLASGSFTSDPLAATDNAGLSPAG